MSRQAFRNCILVASSDEELARTSKKHNRLNHVKYFEELNQTLFVAFDWELSLSMMMEQFKLNPIEYFEQQAVLAMGNDDKESKVELDVKNCKFYCVIRTPWNYVQHYGKFIKWLEIMNQLGKEEKLMTFNNPELLMWNSTKRYLFEIQDTWQGYSIVPSELVDKAVSESLSNEEIVEKYTEKFNCDKLVFKPLISAGSYFTFVVSKQDEHASDYAKETSSKMDKLKEFFQSEMDQDYPDRNIMMVQPFMEEIVKDGEYSFLFVNEKPSHMLWKKPKDGDFRVQGNYGGSNVCIPKERFNSTILENAQKLFDKIKNEKSPNHLLLYCRLDVIIDWTTNELKICELELLEPHLYFETINPNDKSVELDHECKLYKSTVQQ